MKRMCTALLASLLCALAVAAGAQSAIIDNKNEVGGNKRLNLRLEAATTSGSYGLFYDGAEVERQEIAGEWAKVTVGSQTGYVLNEFLITPDEAKAKGLPEGTAAQADVALPAEELTLREEPSAKAKALGTIENGAQLRILGFLDDWAYVKTVQEPVQTGYALSKYVSETENLKYGLVSSADASKKAKLRLDASAKSRVIGQYYNGVQAVRLFSFQRDGWVRVRIGDVAGWMAEEDLYFGTDARTSFPYYPPITSIAVKKTELRAQASEKSAELLTCEKEESIEVLGESENGKWLHVRAYDGNPYGLTGLTGYVKASAVGKLATNTDGTHGLYAVVAPDAVGGGHTSLQPLYKEAKADAEELGLYYQGVEMELLDLTLSAWARVRVAGQEGYMLKQDLLIQKGEGDPAATEPPLPTVQVTAADGAALREQPKADATGVENVPGGARVTLLGVQGAWCCVRTEEKSGFMPRAQLSGDIAGYARTNESKLALRKEANSKAEVLARIPQGRRVLVIATNGEWKYVEYDGERGYAMTKYLEFEN